MLARVCRLNLNLQMTDYLVGPVTGILGGCMPAATVMHIDCMHRLQRMMLDVPQLSQWQHRGGIPDVAMDRPCSSETRFGDGVPLYTVAAAIGRRETAPAGRPGREAVLADHLLLAPCLCGLRLAAI